MARKCKVKGCNIDASAPKGSPRYKAHLCMYHWNRQVRHKGEVYGDKSW